MSLPGSGMSGFFGRAPGGFLGFGKTPIGAIKPTPPVRPTGFAGDALSRGGARTPNITITRPAPRPTPLTPAQRGAQTRASNRADAAKAAANRDAARNPINNPANAYSVGGRATPNPNRGSSAPSPQTAPTRTTTNSPSARSKTTAASRGSDAIDAAANIGQGYVKAAKVGIGVASGLAATSGVIAAKIISSNNNRNTNSSSSSSSVQHPRPVRPYDPNLNPAPLVSSSSRTTNMDNPSKLAFYLAWAKAENLTGKDASNFAYTRLKEYKRGGRISGGL